MRRVAWLLLSLALAFAPSAALAEFNAAAYQPASQAELVKNKDAVGKKFRVSEPFQFCGSDFCVQKKMKIDTREHFCFTLGPLCLVRMYIKKDHPQVQSVLDLKKGDKVTVYGVFERMGNDFHYLVVDHVAVDRKPGTP
jgi:hypothetical protein